MIQETPITEAEIFAAVHSDVQKGLSFPIAIDRAIKLRKKVKEAIIAHNEVVLMELEAETAEKEAELAESSAEQEAIDTIEESPEPTEE